MKDYREFLLIEAHTDHYDLVLICLSHESFLTYLDEIENDERIKEGSGTILIDQLMVTGDGKNRFVVCEYKKGKLIVDSAEVESPEDTYRDFSSKHFKSRIEQLENSILSDKQFESLKNGETI